VACPGEVKPVSLVLWAALELPEVTVSVTDLQGPWAVVPASQVSVRFVKQWALQESGSVPAVLPRERNQQVWCAVQVPETVGSGTYKGSIVLCSAGTELGRLPVSLEVLPFRLEPFPSGHEGRLYGGKPSSEHLDPELCRMGHGIRFWRAQRSARQIQASATVPEGGEESLFFEGLREGETDVRYILTLEKEIERVMGKANQVGMVEGENRASEALSWLHGLDEQDEDLDGMRGRVIRFLLTLKNY